MRHDRAAPIAKWVGIIYLWGIALSIIDYIFFVIFGLASDLELQYSLVGIAIGSVFYLIVGLITIVVAIIFYTTLKKWSKATDQFGVANRGNQQPGVPMGQPV